MTVAEVAISFVVGRLNYLDQRNRERRTNHDFNLTPHPGWITCRQATSIRVLIEPSLAQARSPVGGGNETCRLTH